MGANPSRSSKLKMKYIPYNIVTQFKDFFPHKKSTSTVTPVVSGPKMFSSVEKMLLDRKLQCIGIAVQDPSKCLTFIP